ncbi:MAG TPA: hypothetical protein VLY63_29230 [Anaerolineae bacterium]|nr:hypothetical protein [Anaerolineae bacterium]
MTIHAQVNPRVAESKGLRTAKPPRLRMYARQAADEAERLVPSASSGRALVRTVGSVNFRQFGTHGVDRTQVLVEHLTIEEE